MVFSQTLMERRIRPWINKKIIEYIGEEEATLVDFVCSKVCIFCILWSCGFAPYLNCNSYSCTHVYNGLSRQSPGSFVTQFISRKSKAEVEYLPCFHYIQVCVYIYMYTYISVYKKIELCGIERHLIWFWKEKYLAGKWEIQLWGVIHKEFCLCLSISSLLLKEGKLFPLTKKT